MTVRRKTAEQREAIIELLRTEGLMLTGDISRALGIRYPGQSAYQILDGMARHGLVERVHVTYQWMYWRLVEVTDADLNALLEGAFDE